MEDTEKIELNLEMNKPKITTVVLNLWATTAKRVAYRYFAYQMLTL